MLKIWVYYTDWLLSRPYVAYKAEHFWDTWCEGGPPNTWYNRTKFGWFDAVCLSDWVKTISLFHLWRLQGMKVVTDGNLSSHFNMEIIYICTEHDNKFIMLPPNSAHITQPLRHCPLPLFKRAWREILAKFKMVHPKISSLSINMFPSLLSELKAAITPREKENLISGFRAAGIYPLNRNKVLKIFLCTFPLRLQGHLPTHCCNIHRNHSLSHPCVSTWKLRS